MNFFRINPFSLLSLILCFVRDEELIDHLFSSLMGGLVVYLDLEVERNSSHEEQAMRKNSGWIYLSILL